MISLFFKVIRKLISSTLQMADSDGMTSLAFPAVGTGIKLRTPSRVVADTMIDEVIKFSAETKKTSLKEVQFVIYEKDQDALDVSRSSFIIKCIIAIFVLNIFK